MQHDGCKNEEMEGQHDVKAHEKRSQITSCLPVLSTALSFPFPAVEGSLAAPPENLVGSSGLPSDVMLDHALNVAHGLDAGCDGGVIER
jgi:hypothetical protein